MRITFAVLGIIIVFIISFDVEQYVSSREYPNMYSFTPSLTIPYSHIDNCRHRSITGNVETLTDCEKGLALISRFGSLLLSSLIVIFAVIGATLFLRIGKNDKIKDE